MISDLNRIFALQLKKQANTNNFNLRLDPEKTILAMGTLYTDLIESGKGVGKKAATIKSHHNVGCQFIDDLKAAGRVVEPNRLIFKDEVRGLGREIELPPEIKKRIV